jgi:hypothetical protein
MTSKHYCSQKKSEYIFKGFPLLDFLHPKALDVDNIFSHPVLIDVLKAHVEEFTRGVSSESSTGGIGVNTPNVAGAVNTHHTNSTSSGPANTAGRKPSNVNNDNVFVEENVQPSFEDLLKDFLKGVYLGKFESSVYQPVASRPPLKYVYDLGFNTDKTVGFVVKSPHDTLITFAPRDPRYPYNDSGNTPVRIPSVPVVNIAAATVLASEGSSRISNKLGSSLSLSFEGSNVAVKVPRKLSNVCDLNFRITVNNKNQLQELNMFGDTLKVHLSKSLVQPVERTNSGKWVKTGRRLGFEVGERIITFKRNQVPTWGGVMKLDGIPVSISISNMMGKLNKINFGGTPEKPLIVFDDVEILTK